MKIRQAKKLDCTSADKHEVNDCEVIRQMAATLDISVDIRKVQQYSAYMQGARKALIAFSEQFPGIFKGKDAAYNRALLRLVTSSLRNTDLYLTGEDEIHFRNSERDKKGKCVKCEAYFSRQVINKENKEE